MAVLLDKFIEQTPGTCGGKPRIAGRRITVANVAIQHLRMGMSLEEIAGKYELPMAAVHAAMAYYYDQRETIDRTIEEDQSYVEALQKEHPSLLRARLNALRDG